MSNVKAAYTISASSDDHAENHSRRAYTPFSAEASLSNRNIVIYDCGNDRQHFNEFFEPAIRAYNDKQKRADRKKDLDYLGALEDGREGYGKGDKKEKPFYHDVIQIGDHNTNGITDDSFDVDHWRELKRANSFKEAADYVSKHLPKPGSNEYEYQQEMIQVLQEIAEEIRDNKDNKYSNILVHGLTIHCDEPNGTPHLDFRYSIYTDGEKTGIGTRISMNKGLKKMGYTYSKDEIPINMFRDDIKDRIEAKMKERGFERIFKNEHRKHLKTAVYELEQRAARAEANAEAAERKVFEIEQREAEANRILEEAKKIKASLEKIAANVSGELRISDQIASSIEEIRHRVKRKKDKDTDKSAPEKASSHRIDTKVEERHRFYLFCDQNGINYGRGDDFDQLKYDEAQRLYAEYLKQKDRDDKEDEREEGTNVKASSKLRESVIPVSRPKKTDEEIQMELTRSRYQMTLQELPLINPNKQTQRSL